MLQNRNPKSLQLHLIADPRLHQDLRGVYSAGRKYDLRSRDDAMDIAVAENFYASGPLCIEGDLRDSQDCQIRPVAMREDVRKERGLTLAVANALVRDRGPTLTVHHSTVLGHTLECQSIGFLQFQPARLDAGRAQAARGLLLPYRDTSDRAHRANPRFGVKYLIRIRSSMPDRRLLKRRNPSRSCGHGPIS